MRSTQRLEVQGGELALEHEPDGEGLPVVLVHAGIADRSMWDGVVDRLAGRPWVRYDLRGFGDSGLLDGAGPYRPREDLIAVLDALGIERAAVCAISFGGGIAIDAAIDFPDRVAALIAVATGAFGAERDPALDAQMEEADAIGEAGDLDRAVELELRMWVDGPQRGPDELDPALRERARVMDLRAWQAGAGGEPEPLQPLAAGRLGEIRATTLVICGDLDHPSTLTRCRDLAEQIAGARLVIMSGVAHLAPLEQPEAFARLVVDFLADVDR